MHTNINYEHEHKRSQAARPWMSKPWMKLLEFVFSPRLLAYSLALA